MVESTTESSSEVATATIRRVAHHGAPKARRALRRSHVSGHGATRSPRCSGRVTRVLGELRPLGVFQVRVEIHRLQTSTW